MDTDGQFNKLDQMLPTKRSQSPEDRAKDIESALDWCRNHSVLPLDDGSLSGFKKIGSIPVSIRSPEDRRKDVEDGLNWLRAGKPDDQDMSVEFKEINSLLPTKKSQWPEDPAMDIESALHWCRDNNVSPFDEDFTELGSIPVSRRSPEDR
jgi:hypothetical protein